jgi:hypothetical protein
MPLIEIIHYKDLYLGPLTTKKKSRPRRSLSPPHTLPIEATTFQACQGAKEGLDLEQASLKRDPPKPISTTSAHNSLVQHLEEGSKDIHFLTMRFSNKAYIPPSRTAKNLHIIHN